MWRNFRKIIAFTLSSAMVIGSPASILAEEPETSAASGVGQMEEIIKPDIYQVILPMDVNGIFDFVIDPQKLIEKTNAAIYGGKTYEKGATVFFHRSDGRTAEEYGSSSDHLTISNRSTLPVDVLINVGISPESLGGIAMTDDREFTDDTSTSLYMALTDGERTVPVGTEGSYIQATIPAAPEDAFEYSYDQESGEYSYGLKDDLSGIQFPEYSFQLTGAVNEKGDWSTVKDVALLVNVTWEVTPGQSQDSPESKEPAQEEPKDSVQEEAPEPKDSVQEEVPEQNPIFSQTLETVPVEKEGQKDENIQERTLHLNGEGAPAEKNDVDAENVESGEDKAPNIAKTSYTLKAGKPLSIDVDLGSGSAAATKVASVRWKETDNELLGTEDETDAVRYEEGKLLFSKAWVDECLADAGKRSAVLVVAFDDAKETQKEVVLKH